MASDVGWLGDVLDAVERTIAAAAQTHSVNIVGLVKI